MAEEHKPFQQEKALTERLDIDLALKAAGLGVWEMDPITNTISWDDRCRYLFGLNNTNKLSYEQALQYIHPEDVSRVSEAVKSAMNPGSGGDYDVTFRTIGANGGVLRWVRFIGKGYFNQEGEVYRFSGVARDVTKDVQTAHQAEASEAQLLALIEETPVATSLLTGRELIVAMANKSMLDIWGKGSSVIGKPLAQALPELQGQPFLQILDDVYTGGQSYQAVATRCDLVRNGQLGTYYFDFTYKPLWNEAGEVYGIMDVAIDVTEEVKAQQKLKESDLYFRRLTDTLPAIIWITEPDGNCSYLNKQWYAYTGQTSAEAEGFGWLNATHPYDKAEAGRLFVEANNRQQPFTAIYRLRHRDGTYRWAIDMAQPRFTDEGVYEGMIGTVVDIHDQRLAEQALRESESRLRSIITSAPVAIGLFVGRDLLVELPNQAFIDIVGKGPDVIGKPLREVMPELITENQPFLQILDDVFTSGKTFQSFGSLVKIVRSGVLTHNYYNITYSPLFDDEGKVYAILDIATDVTEHIRSQKRVEESESRFRNLIEQAPVAMLVVKGEDLVIETVNQSMLGIMGRNVEIVGRPLEVAMPELAGQPLPAQCRQVFRSGTPYYGWGVEAQVHRNGTMETGYYNVAYTPVYEGGSITGVMQVVTDVTDQVTTQRNLEESEARFRSLVEEAPIATCLFVGQQMQIEVANKGMIRFFGKGSSILGKPIREVLTREQEQAAIHLLEKVFTTGHPFVAREVPSELVIDDIAGIYYFNIYLKPIKNADGEVYAIIEMAEDVTEQVLARQKLEESEVRYRHLSARLEEQVKQRTQQLEASVQDLQRSNENLQQFAYVASHDLQEPLRKIQSFGDILKVQYADQLGEGLSHLQRMQSAAIRMSTLIRDLLTFSRISTQQDATGSVSLTDIVEAVLSDLEITILETGAQIQVDSLPMVQGDASQLSQLFQNLLSNAFKFRQEGHAPLIRISSHSVPESALPPLVTPTRAAKLYHRIDVTDNGIGFDDKYVDRIFQVFQRLHSRNEFAGTGIGLAICHKVAANHGGAITATSQPGSGSTFSVYLPYQGE